MGGNHEVGIASTDVKTERTCEALQSHSVTLADDRRLIAKQCAQNYGESLLMINADDADDELSTTVMMMVIMKYAIYSMPSPWHKMKLKDGTRAAAVLAGWREHDSY
eukprot:937195-Amphidinium_carterae.1